MTRALRSRRPAGRDLIESLSHVHRLVLSGHALDAAIANAVLVQPSKELVGLYELMSQGDDITTACRRRLESTRHVTNSGDDERDGAIAYHVLSLAGSIGGRIAEQLDSLIDLLEDRESVRRERRTQAASASASMRLLTWLPLVCGGWILMDGATVRAFVFGSIPGWTCLVLGVVLNLLGRAWMERMVSSC